MVPHSSTLAWKIPWMEEPGRLQFMVSRRVGHDWVTEWLSDFTFHFHALEKEMATHFSVLTWRIPGTVGPGELMFMGSHRVRHDWSDLAAVAAAVDNIHPSGTKETELICATHSKADEFYINLKHKHKFDWETWNKWMNTGSFYLHKFSSVHSLRHVQFYRPMDCSTQAFPVLCQHPELAQTHAHLVCNAIQPSHSLSSPSPPAFNFSHHWVFPNESVLHIRYPKYWTFSFSMSTSKGYSGLISFRIDWLELLEVQGTLKSLLQHHSSKASILQHSAFFIVQLSQPYMTTRKTTVLTRWTFVGKASLCFLICCLGWS